MYSFEDTKKIKHGKDNANIIYSLIKKVNWKKLTILYIIIKYITNPNAISYSIIPSHLAFLFILKYVFSI